jgi:hypothetical protein
MKVEKHFAALAVCLVVLCASSFAPYSCEAPREVAAWVKIAGAALLLTGFMYPLAYDVISFLTYRLGWEGSFDHLEVFPGDPPSPNAQPVALKTKLLLFYPIDLAAIIFVLLPLWMYAANCG